MENFPKFSLFEIEKVNIEELKQEFPRQIGKNDNLTRYNIALELEKEGRLKDCPLLSNKYNRETFEKVISSDFAELKGIITEFITEDLWYNHRILCVYMIYAENLLIPTWYNKTRELFEYSIYYDESYFEEIRSLSDDDLEMIIEILEDFGYDFVYTHIMKEFSESVYDEIKNGDEIPECNKLFLCAHLSVLADERNDNEMIIIMDKITDTIDEYINIPDDKWFLDYSFELNPNVETAMIMFEHEYDPIKLSLGILSSVMGTSPYVKISYKKYIDIMEYIVKIYTLGTESRKIEGNCNDFFSECIKQVKTEKARKYLLAAMLNICKEKSFMSDIVSKSNVISYVPEDYYQ